ncbi:hypothetical protein BLAT2472_30536 [Burkholderia latens]
MRRPSVYKWTGRFCPIGQWTATCRRPGVRTGRRADDTKLTGRDTEALQPERRNLPDRRVPEWHRQWRFVIERIPASLLAFVVRARLPSRLRAAP